MKKNLLVVAALSTCALGVFAVTSASSSGTIFNAGSGAVWGHYTGKASTETERGVKEYWVNCDGSGYQFEAPSGVTPIEKGEAPTDFSGFTADDARWADLKEYDFSTKDSLVGAGASITQMSTGGDVSWMFGSNTLGKKEFSFKAYSDEGGYFRWTFPRVNFNYYSTVTADITSTIWNEGFKIGFSADGGDAKTPETGVKDGGKLILEGKGGNVVSFKLTFAGITLEKEFTDADVYNGVSSPSVYAMANGDALLKITNWTPNKPCTTHAYGDWSDVTSLFGKKTRTCSACGYQEEVLETTYDFTKNLYGATYVKDNTDDLAWKLTKEEKSLTYNLYSDGATSYLFALSMPKINLISYSKVTVTVSSANWYENIGLGFTEEVAKAKTYHTTFGGKKEGGSLTFEKSDDSSYAVTLKFENVTMATTLQDADIINGNASFKVYLDGNLYDRSIVFSDFAAE